MNNLRKRLDGLLGYAGLETRFCDVETIGTQQRNGACIQDLRFHTLDGESANAWFVLLNLETDGPRPAILYLHAHGNRYDIGRGELFDGRPALYRPYIGDLIELGFAILCIEMPCFGARAAPTESSRAKAHSWYGKTLFGQMLYELRCGMTYLCEHPAIDATRIGTLGISMGGTQAYWLAALDDRVCAAVSLCAFADLACLIDEGQHDKHGQYMTVPGLLALTSTGRIAGLIAPRPLFVGVGMRDWSSPKACFDTAFRELDECYAETAGRARLEVHVEQESGHEETALMRRATLAFLAKHLCI
ncbi:MAG: hypothetical protein AAFO77_07195 [Pseudomonadota bacterium]